MKKVVLFLLALTYAIPIRALNSYTEYQFVGYVEEMKEDDELYKYEPVTFNKYYELVEEKMGYYEIGSVEDYSSIDMEDKISEVVTSLSPDENKTAAYEIAIDCPYNFASTGLSVLNIKNHENVKIKEIEMYSNNKKISVSPMIIEFTDGDYENYAPLQVNRFELYYKKTYLNQLSIVMYYDQDEDLEFQLHIKGASDSQYIDKNIVINKDFKKVTINILSSTVFDSFKIFNNLEGESLIQYYKYTDNKYMHYQQNRKYRLDDEDGLHPEYSYDPQESYTMYKEYKRELIENNQEDSGHTEGDDSDDQKEETDKKDEIEPPKDKEDSSEDKPPSTIPSDKENEEENVPIKPDPPKEDEKPQRPTVIVIPSKPEKEEQDKVEETDENLGADEKNDTDIPTQDLIDKVEDNKIESTEVLAFNNEQASKKKEEYVPKTHTSDVKDKDDEVVDKVDIEDKTIDLSSSLESSECKKDPSAFTIIGTFLIFISLVLDIIYFINVKKKKE